ncbi:MAG: hypothetical protein K9N48_03990 [Verrucomicrobia bacterium]|nr:hypothetical protein [Verrucomicrobiota bacterium]MCF7709017.1 hypothetical protein [Verrucomicrobiota bacterium]
MQNQTRDNIFRHRSGGAFTLIELLTVISIIIIIAALLIGLSNVAGKKMRISRVESEMHKLSTAIDSYKSQFGFYPPDNSTNVPNTNIERNANPAVNPLFYELTGTVVTNNGFLCLKHQEVISMDNVEKAFNLDGFVNSAKTLENTHNFLPELKESEHSHIDVGAHVSVLVVPVEGPRDSNGFPLYTDHGGTPINPWRYVSTNPTNNPTSYDLWAEINISGEIITIGNWQQ